MNIPLETGSENPTPNTTASIDFLIAFAPGLWPLVAISPKGGKPIAQTFTPDSAEFCHHWIDRFQGVSNIYFMPNTPTHMVTRKAKKTDVAAMTCLHVDVDPEAGKDFDAERERILANLQKFEPEPTVIIDSGGGYQAFWRLATPVPVNGNEATCEELESYNRQLELLLGGDCCHNLDRIMRLPGTINVPNEKKRAKGRKKALATIIHFKHDLVYSLEKFKTAPAGASRGETAGRQVQPNVLRVALPESLPQIEDLESLGVSEATQVLILHGCDPDDPDKWTDRSRLVFHVLCEMLRANNDNNTMASVITDPTLLVSAHVLDHKGDILQYAARQIERAREEVGVNIMRNFIQTKDGKIRKDLPENIEIAISQLGMRLSFDEFAGRELIQTGNGLKQLVTDTTISNLWYSINTHFGPTTGYTPNAALVERVVGVVAQKNRFHPVRDYLDGLTWDRVPRIDNWLTQYGGAPDTEFVREISRILLVATVRRVRQPGCKFDEMVILEGAQGTNKSSALRLLAIRAEWFTDNLNLDMSTKELMEIIEGRLIVEAPELNGLSPKGDNHLKALLGRQEDEARQSYGKRRSEAKRQCVFVGTTNSTQYLRDQSGNRRFWPVKIRQFDLEQLERDRDQLWAEASVVEARGESIRLSARLREAAGNEQEARRIGDAWEAVLSNELGDKFGKIRVADLFVLLDAPAGRQPPGATKRLAGVMMAMGWQSAKLRFGGKNPECCYAKGDAYERLNELRVVFDSQTQVRRIQDNDHLPLTGRQIELEQNDSN